MRQNASPQVKAPRYDTEFETLQVVGFDAAIAPTLFSNATDADGNERYDVV